MKKIVLIVTLLLMVVLCSCSEESTVHRKESPVEDFEYEMYEGEIIITGYKGTDRKIYIPSKINGRLVTKIGEKAFDGYDMTSITIPDTVVSIGRYAFHRCSCLTKVVFSDKLETISDGAFWYCGKLTEVLFPESLQKIGAYAFSDCDALTKVRFSEGLQYLGEESFANCGNLESLRIPDNTDMRMSVRTQAIGYYGYATTFVSPVGRSSTTTYFDSNTDASAGNKEFSQLNTTIIVSDGSYAYSQVKDYTNYGLNIKVE